MDATTTTSTAVMPGLAALCQEIRSVNWMGEERDGKHFWAIGLSFGFQMQSITCAICGNYQSVSSEELQQSISHAVLCTNIDHFNYTEDVIDLEENGPYSDDGEDLELDEDLEEGELTQAEWEILSMRQ